VFYALVAVHYTIPIYALYPVGIVLVGILSLTSPGPSRTLAAVVSLSAVLVGLAFQAGQPLTRQLVGTVRGDQIALAAEGPPGASVRIDRHDRALYDELLAFINQNAAPGDPILAMPMNTELYFLSGHRAAVAFPITPLGLLDDEDVEKARGHLQQTRPAVVIFKPSDKYTTPRVRRLMDLLRADYRLCKSVEGFELYAPTCRTQAN
jgi:hypothetical protein